MPWTESEFVQRANEIAQQHVTSKKSLNELSMKVARDSSLNPDEIRTLVRLANVATFQEMFKRKTDGDKIVDFDVGDPEQVIRKFSEEAATVPQSANVLNDKLAEEIPDMMRERRLGGKFDTVKEASQEDAPERAPRTDMVIISLRKLAESFDVERVISGNRWEQKIAELALMYRRPAGYVKAPALAELEKDAYAEFGEDAQHELAGLWDELRKGRYTAPTTEKIAHLQEYHAVDSSKALDLLKEAREARLAYKKYQNGLAWIERNMPKLGV